MKIEDNTFQTEFLLAKLSESIWFGAAPINEKEVKKLKMLGINNFINLNDFDMDQNLWKYACINGLKFENKWLNGKVFKMKELHGDKISQAAQEIQKEVQLNKVMRSIYSDCLCS